MKGGDEASASRRLRVLIVEPEEEACQNLARIFEVAQVDVMSAQRGLQGLELFARERVDLVLSAMDLPDLPGTELLDRVMSRSASVRVALMAPWRSRSQFEEMMQSGVFAFLRKPVREHEVLKMLGQLKATVDFTE